MSIFCVEFRLNILLPQIRRFENDNGLLINFETALSGYPMATSSAYGQGTFCLLAVPDDFADLYRLPRSVLNQIRTLMGQELFVRLDAPDHVGLFAYDNRTFIVQNFQPQPVTTRALVTGANRLHDLLKEQIIAPSPTGDALGGGFGRGRDGRGELGGGPSFEVAIPAHSFRAFAVE